MSGSDGMRHGSLGLVQVGCLENEILQIIAEKGPLTGSELRGAVGGGDPLPLWQACRRSDRILIRTVGSRYLRLDRRMPGYARLSPSILREFLTYTVVGTRESGDALQEKALAMTAHIQAVSQAKLDIAYRVASGLETCAEIGQDPDREVCFIIAGDIVYNMAHDVPRPERSTGKMVRGSDIDMVVIVDEDMPDSLMKRLDEEIYAEKALILTAPRVREEIDYVVKKPSRVLEQVQFDTFKRMVACKILQEGTLLYGSESMFSRVKAMLANSGVTEKVKSLESEARKSRADAEEWLLRAKQGPMTESDRLFFYPSEESEEFE